MSNSRYRGNRSFIGGAQTEGGIIDLSQSRIGSGSSDTNIPFQMVYPDNIDMTGGFTLVQIFAASFFTNPATQLRLFVGNSGTTASQVIDTVSVSQVASSGNAWDAAADITEVTWSGGSSGITLASGAAAMSDWIDYALDPDESLMLTLHTATRISLFTSAVSGVTFYQKNTSADETMTQVREASYTSQTRAGPFAIIETR